MAVSTESMRQAWAEFECAESKMRRIDFGPDSILVAPPTVEAFKALERVLLSFGYRIRVGDTDSYNCREIKGGGGKSLHSYGIALDVNWNTNPWRDHTGKRGPRFSDASTQDSRAEDVRLGRADTDMTPEMIQAVVAIRTNGGKQVFDWGGNWQSLKDAMHFQVQVTPDELATGINWSTVAGRSTTESEMRTHSGGGHSQTPGPMFPPDYADDSYTYSYDNDDSDSGVTLSEGDNGPMVTALQKALKDLNYAVGAVDGVYGPLTRDAVLAFQATNGLPLTGAANAETLNALAGGRPRSLSQDRMMTTEDDLQKKGSRIINSAGWNRWLGIATSVLGVLGISDSQFNFVGRIGDALKVAAGATAGEPSQAQISAAVADALAKLPANATATDQTAAINAALQALETQVAGGNVAADGGGAIIGPLISVAQGLLGAGGLGPWAMLAAAGFFVWRNAKKTGEFRVQEHRTGMNLEK